MTVSLLRRVLPYEVDFSFSVWMVNNITWVFHVKWKLSQKTKDLKQWPYIIHEAVPSILCVRWLFDGEYSITLQRWFTMMRVVEMSLVRKHWQSSHGLYTSECVPALLKEHINSHFCLYAPPFCWLIPAVRRKTGKYLLAGKATASTGKHLSLTLVLIFCKSPSVYHIMYFIHAFNFYSRRQVLALFVPKNFRIEAECMIQV